MYRYLDEQLPKLKKKLKTEVNHIGTMGFDELNVVGTKKTTKAMFERLLANNENAFLRVAKSTHKDAVKTARAAGFVGGEETEIDLDWLMGVLLAYNLVTGYVYDREAERKRLRLNEQILTAREFGSRQMLHDSLQRTANLWWTQTSQYGIDVVDQATLRGYRDMGVDRVRWVAIIDTATCGVCRGRNGVIYKINEVPAKTHYGCRCRLEPVRE